MEGWRRGRKKGLDSPAARTPGQQQLELRGESGHTVARTTISLSLSLSLWLSLFLSRSVSFSSLLSLSLPVSLGVHESSLPISLALRLSLDQGKTREHLSYHLLLKQGMVLGAVRPAWSGGSWRWPSSGVRTWPSEEQLQGGQVSSRGRVPPLPSSLPSFLEDSGPTRRNDSISPWLCLCSCTRL